ncbi:vacuolar targeting, actin-related protein [Pseudozyma hubeiensis SY62]|uniref:Vacuolar targeting, actin-related protein n=1 Tax=Pseudozyma hubeiensis (strain SY62) TaxID=1305764 RepID=R9P8G3_PSEHS|nr:vacuolar targeting, actin-related protein [Pseudozyma hubeiensis SY62]GAC97661.1 vacuolar targeting, actin-related protein [Pseudozyma hubeiensis SY62]
MGQHPSKPPSHEPTPDSTQPYPVAASGWLKSTRRRKTGTRNDTVASPNHRFIPQGERQRSAGPIRSRPQPSEYGVGRPTGSSVLSSEEEPCYRPTLETAPAALSSAAQTQPSVLVRSTNNSDVQSHRRWSGQHLTPSLRELPLQRHAILHEDRTDPRSATSAAYKNKSTSQHRVMHPTATGPASNVRRSWPYHSDMPSFVGEALTDNDDKVKHEPSRGRTNVKSLPVSSFGDPIMQSTATTSLGTDSNLSYAHRIGLIELTNIERRKVAPSDHSISGLPARVAHDDREDTLAPRLSSQDRFQMLRSSHSGYAPSSNSSLGTTEVERLRQGPELKLHRDSIHVVFSSQTPSSPSRSRALIAKLRGIKNSGAEDPAAELKDAATGTSPRAPTLNISGGQSCSQSVPQLQFPTKSVIWERLPSTALQQSHPHVPPERRTSQPPLQEPCTPLPPRLDERQEGLSSPMSSNSSLLLMGETRSSPPRGVVRGLAPREAGVHASNRDVPDTDRHPQARVKPPTLETGQPALVKDSAAKTSTSVKAAEVKQGGFWNWPRRPSASRLLNFGQTRSRSGRQLRIEIEDAPPSRFESHPSPVSPRSKVDVVGMAVNTPLAASRPDVTGPSMGSSTRSSYSSLAPPVPPSPLPPLRRSRKGSQQAQTTFRQDRIDSVDSSVASGSTETRHGRSTYNLHHSIPEDSIRPPPSAAAVSAVSAASETGASTSAVASVVGKPSTVATSLSAALESQDPSSPIGPLKGTFGGQKGYLSPGPTVSRPLSETSDAGTKEILLSDRESLAGPKMSSDTFARGSFEERHPDLKSYYPASAFLSSSARPRYSGTSPSPLSRMLELDGGTSQMRHVGAVPDVSASTAPSRVDVNLGNDKSVDSQREQLPRSSRSFHSARSFRSTSDASVQPYRPLPAVPVRNRGNSLDPASIQRFSGQGPGTSFSPAEHVQAKRLGYSSGQEIDGLPSRHTQPTFMLMGMVAAATSPTEATHSSHDRNSIGGENYARRTSRSSIGSPTSPTAESHKPTTQTGNADVPVKVVEAQSKRAFRRPTSLIVPRGAHTGPPLSPSAFYESSSQRFVRPAASPMGPRQSWSSAEDQSSATVVTPTSTQGLVRGMTSPGKAQSEESVFAKTLVETQAPSTRVGFGYPSTLTRTPDDVQEDGLLQLESSRSGRGILLPSTPSSKDIDLPDSVERAPYADTGVQASLAALRARESPGESLRTILARQRILGEPDESMTEFLRESRVLDTESHLEEEAMRAVSGPRRRRRSAPYPQLSGSRYSSDELSSSGRSLSGFRAEAARRRRQRNNTGMADASGSWVSGIGGRESDSESTMLTAIRLSRSRIKDASVHTDAAEDVSDRNVHDTRRKASVASETTELQPARQVVSASSVALRRENVPPFQDAYLYADQHGDSERPKRPRHQRYVTALSQSDQTTPSAQQDAQLPDTVAPSDALQSSQANEDGRAYSNPRSVSMPHAQTKFISHGPKHGLEASDARTTKFPAEAPDDRMTQRMLAQRQRQRSHSDAHTSASRSSKFTSRRSGRLDDERSRYDAQIEDLLLLREKVLQLEASISRVRQTDLQASFDDDQHGSVSLEDPARRSRKSSISSKRKSRPPKVGYTMPDIVAWQAGLGDSIGSNQASAMPTSSTVA